EDPTALSPEATAARQKCEAAAHASSKACRCNCGATICDAPPSARPIRLSGVAGAHLHQRAIAEAVGQTSLRLTTRQTEASAHAVIAATATRALAKCSGHW